jgi:hypothetical protein
VGKQERAARQRRSCSSRRAVGQAPHVDASRGECVAPQLPRELALRRGSALCLMRWMTRAAPGWWGEKLIRLRDW